MAQRERAAARSKRASGNMDNLAKGHAANRNRKQKATEANGGVPLPRASERWALLLSGQLTVRDLDDQEVKRMQVRGADGKFTGKGRKLPSHLAQQFAQERVRRAKEHIDKMGITAIKELTKMATDPDVDANVRARLLVYLTDRVLGKTPDTVRIEGMSGFDKMLAEAVGLEADILDEA